MIKCHNQTLPNGLRLVAVVVPHLHSAELALYVKVGGRDDPPGKAGLSHFLEHMLFRGTAEFPTTLELETAFEAIGGSVNASTDEESTCYFSRIHPRHAARGIELLASMILRPTLTDLETEKKIITEEALDDLNERGEEVNPHNLASRLLWPDQPLGRPTIGFLDSIAAFTQDDLEQHLASYYIPGNAVLVVAGDILPEEVFTAAAAAFGGWKVSAVPKALPATTVQSRPQSLFVKDADSQAHLQLAFRGFARHAPQIMATRLLRRILCGGGSSRLHLHLREKLGIVYSVDASISAYEETGSFAIELATAPENLPLAVKEVLAAASLLATEPVPDAELRRIKQSYFFDLEYSRDSSYEMQVRYGWGELMGLVRHIEEDIAEAQILDGPGLQQAAAELFRPANLNLVVVGAWEEREKAAVEQILTAYKLA
jgi:predicted Zn-dependent peptidase